LSVVCTPIGNLGDLSPRASEALASADVVLAEDTRRTRPLLEHTGSKAKLISCHQHNEAERADEVVERLRAGERVALVSDAGAPGVSDPGGRLVDAVVEAGLEVEVLPGASAVIAALMGAGLVAHHFSFLGFLPRKAGAQRKAAQTVPAGHALVFFEAPNRVPTTLRALAEVLGERRVVVGRELTKKFETFHRGVLGGELSPPLVDKGEVVVVVEAGDANAPGLARDVDESELTAELLADASLKPRARAKKLAEALGISASDAYERLEAARDDVGDAPDDHEGKSEMEKAQAHIARAFTRSAPARRALLEHLADAASALLAADRAAGGATPDGGSGPVDSGIPGADALLAWLEERPALPAPVEAEDTARAILAALSAADMLDDALESIAGAHDDDDDGD
jgi:16S rRNA (cytidine1402-2'-O)-methyltransferase